MDVIPQKFEHTVPVPGLVDMAVPAFEEVGVKSDKRDAFWYRRTFTLNSDVTEMALLKVHKAKFGTQVYLNGQLVGDHLFCFTPGYFDVKKHLKPTGEENELVVRVGAFHDAIPQSVHYGFDFEKRRYFPGIYDSVELILAGAPYIKNVQIVPEIGTETALAGLTTSGCRARIVADVHNLGKEKAIDIKYLVREKKSGKVVAKGNVSEPAFENTYDKKMRPIEVVYDVVPFDFDVPIKDCRLWSPEDPFLYELELTTAGDGIRETFGMRSFSLDHRTGRAMLNGKPYYLRGSNVCIFRFFGDDERGDKPWREDWVRRFHQQVRAMNWEALRYCIGFPPEFWYDIADEEGVLIQDEYPIWAGSRGQRWPAECKPENTAEEYREWMRERWNHPCVVIWDAQNESSTPYSGLAIDMVRNLDLSNRPWDNGFALPRHPGDSYEAHPYLFSGYRKIWGKSGLLSDVLTRPIFPHYGPRDKSPEARAGTAVKNKNAIILNEYGWLWINRDGSPTTLTDKVFDRCFGEGLSVKERRYHVARWLAALTEYWRCHRKCAGILHFCALTYSRPTAPGGQTCDHWIDVEKLNYEPQFKEFVSDAFAPVGLMVNYWNSRVKGGVDEKVEVYVINDLDDAWKGKVSFRVEKDGKVLSEDSKSCSVDAYGREMLSFDLNIPAEPEKYKVIAELKGAKGQTITSFRDIEVR